MSRGYKHIKHIYNNFTETTVGLKHFSVLKSIKIIWTIFIIIIIIKYYIINTDAINQI